MQSQFLLSDQRRTASSTTTTTVRQIVALANAYTAIKWTHIFLFFSISYSELWLVRCATHCHNSASNVCIQEKCINKEIDCTHRNATQNQSKPKATVLGILYTRFIWIKICWYTEWYLFLLLSLSLPYHRMKRKKKGEKELSGKSRIGVFSSVEWNLTRGSAAWDLYKRIW